jgi:hypothetical protein
MAGSSRTLSILPLARSPAEAQITNVFDVFCERHGTRVLLTATNIRSLANGSRGIVLRWRCHCGHEGEWVTGVRR